MYKLQLNHQNFVLICISYKNKCFDFRNVKDFPIFGGGVVAKQLRTKQMLIYLV